LIAFLCALDQLIFLDHRFSSFFEVGYIDTGARNLVGAKAKKLCAFPQDFAFGNEEMYFDY
jgi:hypothetical protein